MGEDLECLCQIMKTVGPKLDHEKAKVSVRENIRILVLFCKILFFIFLNKKISLPVFDGSVLLPHAILNKQQGTASKDSLLAAEHSGAAREQLGASQSLC